jgi:hypothetical protein
MNNVNQEVDYKVDLSKPLNENNGSEKETIVNESTNEQVEANDKKEDLDAVQEQTTDEGVLRPTEQSQEVEEKTEMELQQVDDGDKKESVKVSKEEVIAEFLTSKYSMGLEDLEEVLSNKNKNTQDLPDEVKKYLEYKNETKRGLKDFIKVNEDVSDYEENTLLKEYFKQSNPELDDDDIEYLIQDKFTIDENVDTEKDVKRKSLEKKQELHKAKQYFEQMKEKYKAPLESSTENLPEEAKKAVEFYKQYTDEKTREQDVLKKQREVFEKKTSSFFNDEFKGFDFNIGEKTLTYKPKDKNEVVNKQLNLNNFIQSFLDDNGNLVDAKKYHTALNMAMNPEAYAKFFYEQGKSDAVNEVVKDGKNIDMSVRSNVDSSKPGTKFRVVNDSSQFGSKLKIRKK